MTHLQLLAFHPGDRPEDGYSRGMLGKRSRSAPSLIECSSSPIIVPAREDATPYGSSDSAGEANLTAVARFAEYRELPEVVPASPSDRVSMHQPLFGPAAVLPPRPSPLGQRVDSVQLGLARLAKNTRAPAAVVLEMES